MLRRVSFSANIGFFTWLAEQIVPEIDQIRFGRVANRTALGLSAADSERDRLIRLQFARLNIEGSVELDESDYLPFGTQAAQSSSTPMSGSGQPAKNRQGAYDCKSNRRSNCVLKTLLGMQLRIKSG